jgi:uncharacterized protein YndB with AHSA1/START domain
VVDAPAIVREVRIAASPETVFTFFTDPVKLASWKGRSADLDPRPGGIFLVDFNGRDVAEGEFVELDPPNRIVLTWGWRGEGHPVPPGSSRVEITLTPEGGGTLLRLIHSGLPEGTEGLHEEGWDMYLPRLVVVVTGGDPGPHE